MFRSTSRRLAAVAAFAVLTSAAVAAIALAGGSATQAGSTAAADHRDVNGVLLLEGAGPIEVEHVNIGMGELQECTISKSFDSSTPLLIDAVQSRRVFSRATLTVQLGSGSRAGRIAYHLEGVTVKQLTHVSDGGELAESITLSFEKLAVDHTP